MQEVGSISFSSSNNTKEDATPFEDDDPNFVRSKDRIYENLNIQEKFEDFNARTKTNKRSKC